MARNPYKKMMANVKISGRRNLEEQTKLRKNKNFKQKDIEITWEDLEKKFKEQNGKCYWFKNNINLEQVFIPHSPLAPSVDRLDDTIGYIYNNIVITTRFANLGRCTGSVQQMNETIKIIKEAILKTEGIL